MFAGTVQQLTAVGLRSTDDPADVAVLVVEE
jgi:hypothetical protein